MKIAVNSRIVQTGNSGIPLFIKYLYSQLQSFDQDNHYIFFQTSSFPNLGNTLVSNLPHGGFWGSFHDSFLILFNILRTRPHIFHGPSHILPFFKIPGVKYVLTVHDVSFITFPGMAGPIFRNIYSHLLGRSLKVSDIIIADSENTKKDLINIFSVSPQKIQVIYLGISKEYFSKETLPSDISGKYIFTVSTHPIRKNTLAILEAMGSSPKLKKFKLVIAGTYGAQLTNAIQTKSSQLMLTKNVINLGPVSQEKLLSLYHHASLFVYPSFYEGFGLPVLEAMVCKVPVITSNISSLPELMPDSQWLVDPYDITDIKSKMEQILALSSRDLTNLINKNQTFARKFTWEKTASQYLKVFNQINSHE